MRARRFGRTRAAVQGGAIALVVAALVFAFGSRWLTNHSQSLSGVSLTAGSGFLITSSVSSSSSTEVAATLDPGSVRYLWYTVHNQLVVPITVSSLRIASVTPPDGCASSNLDTSHTTFNGSLVVPRKTGSVPGTNSVAVPISLVANPTGGNACKNATFKFSYTGSATYTEVYSTGTLVASTANPSAIGQSVTYTATVKATAGSHQDPVPNSPSGRVTFKDGSHTICADVTVVSASPATSTAQCTPDAYSSDATHKITAVFTNTDGNFSNSTSPEFSQVVSATRKGTAVELDAAPNPSLFGGTASLVATVTKDSRHGTPTGNVSFFLGTPGGTHSLLGTATLKADGRATRTTTSLPTGNDSLYVVYEGNNNFAGSTSRVERQLVVAVPDGCTGPFTLRFGDRHTAIILGTNGNDFIYAISGDHEIHGRAGNDCIEVGDGRNVVNGGDGNEVVRAGDGGNVVFLGSGANSVTVGSGRNRIVARNGDNVITVDGSHDAVTLGSGDNTVTIQNNGSYNSIAVGNGDNAVYLGAGTHNTFVGGRGHNVCHLPAPSSSWHGSVASYYHDSLTHCAVVTS